MHTVTFPFQMALSKVQNHVLRLIKYIIFITRQNCIILISEFKSIQLKLTHVKTMSKMQHGWLLP